MAPVRILTKCPIPQVLWCQILNIFLFYIKSQVSNLWQRWTLEIRVAAVAAAMKNEKWFASVDNKKYYCIFLIIIIAAADASIAF